MSKCVPIPYILGTVVHGMLVSGIFCLLVGTRSRIGLWVFAPCVGFFRELTWPTGYAWADYYIVLLGVIVGLADMVTQLFNVLFVSLQGWLYDNTVPESIFYTTILFSGLLCLFFYVMQFFASRKGPRKLRLVGDVTEVKLTKDEIEVSRL